MLYETPKIFIDDTFVIQIYICYLIEQLGELTDEQIRDIASEYEYVNPLQLTEALSISLEKQLIDSKEKNKKQTVYSLLSNGKVLSKEFYQRIPLSIREKSVEYGKYVLKMADLERSIICRIQRGNFNGPCYLTVKFINEVDGSDLMDLKIYAPDFEQAKQMRERFYEKPSDIVTKIMSMFIRDSYL